MHKQLFTFVIISFIISCTSSPKTKQIQVTTIPKPPIRTAAFITDANDLYSLQQVFSLTLEQQNHFLDWYNSENNQGSASVDRIYNYLEERFKNFNYHTDTFVAQDVLENNTGNCLSLAIITKSLAKLVDIKVGYELVDTPTIYQKENNVIINSQHVRTLLIEKEKDGEFDFLGPKRIRIDYFPSEGIRTLRRITENEFFSMFYTNKAAEYLIENNINSAYLYSIESLKFIPNNHDAINILGLLHARLGYYGDAERLYLHGLEYSKEKEILLENYYNLLRDLKRFDDAAKISIELDRYKNYNPFDWIEIADTAYLEKDYSKAIKYYKRAAKMATYLHEPYAGIAKSKYHLGDFDAASDSILTALTNSHDQKTIKQYRSKYKYFNSFIK